MTFDPDATWEEREDLHDENEDFGWRLLEEREMRGLFPAGDVLDLLDPHPQRVHDSDEREAA